MKSIIQHINIASTALFLGWAVVSCDSKSGQVAAEEPHKEEENNLELTQAQYHQAAIEVGAPERKIIGSELRISGVIDVPPQSNISITLPYGGFIKYIDLLPGSRVKKGQLLVVIENPEFIRFQQEYLESLANQAFLKAEFDRQQQLYDEKVASAKAYQQAKSAFLANEATARTGEARLRLVGLDPARVSEGAISATVNIYAPVSGAVREVYTNLGKYAAPRDVIMDITDSQDLHVELSVYENDAAKVKKGQRIRFSLASAPDEWQEAEVFLVGSGVREDRSVTVHGHLKQAHEGLLPGMYVAARLETGSSEVWAVPEESIVRYDGRHYVFAYNGQRTEHSEIMHDFEMLEVEKGFTEDAYTHVSLPDTTMELSTLKLATKGAFSLLAKSKNTEGHAH